MDNPNDTTSQNPADPTKPVANPVGGTAVGDVVPPGGEDVVDPGASDPTAGQQLPGTEAPVATPATDTIPGAEVPVATPPATEEKPEDSNPTGGTV